MFQMWSAQGLCHSRAMTQLVFASVITPKVSIISVRPADSVCFHFWSAEAGNSKKKLPGHCFLEYSAAYFSLLDGCRSRIPTTAGTWGQVSLVCALPKFLFSFRAHHLHLLIPWAISSPSSPPFPVDFSPLSQAPGNFKPSICSADRNATDGWK